MELNSRNIKRIIFIIFCGAVIVAFTQNFMAATSVIAKIFAGWSYTKELKDLLKEKINE